MHCIQEDDKTQIFPLTPAQYWLLNYFPSPYEWYDQILFSLSLPISLKAIEATIKCLVKRHDGLRTYFIKENDSYLQKVCQSFSIDSPLLYHAEEQPEEDYQKMRQKLTLSICQQFDLSSAPLFKVIIFKRSSRHCEVLFLLHHIIADYIACITLLKEFKILYASFLMDKKATLSPARSNAEYMQNLSKAICRSTLLEMIDIWGKDKLVSTFPFIHAQTPGKEIFSKKFQKILPIELSEKLLKRGKKYFHASSLLYVLVAPLYRVLHKEIGQNQITISQKLHGRSLFQEDFRFIETVGNFAINVPVTCKISRNSSWIEIVKEIEKCFSSLPINGLSYDMLHLMNDHYPYPDHHIAPVRFNYMGISPYQKMIQRVNHPEQHLSTYVEFFVYFHHRLLHIELQYDQTSVDSDSINKIFRRYCEDLKSLSLEF